MSELHDIFNRMSAWELRRFLEMGGSLPAGFLRRTTRLAEVEQSQAAERAAVLTERVPHVMPPLEPTATPLLTIDSVEIPVPRPRSDRS